MKNLTFYLITSTLLLSTPTSASAGIDEDLRDSARAQLSQLQKEGWPKERCYLGVYFSNNIVTKDSGNIIAGDELLYINSSNVQNAKTEDIIDILDNIGPNEIVSIELKRNDQLLSIKNPCQNLAKVQQPYLQALEYAGQKKWHDCISILADETSIPQSIQLRISCAKVSRKPENYPIQQWHDSALRDTLATGMLVPDSRREIATLLLKSRIETSTETYDDLVKQVKTWDNEKTWNEIQPDYDAFRRASERGLKARLVDPQSAIIEMPYDFIYGSWITTFKRNRFEGFITCGTVNAKNRLGGYTGSSYFVTVVDESGYEKYTDLDSSSSEYFHPIESGCSQLIKKLNYIGNVGSNNNSQNNIENRQSISQELEKLSKLHANGALTDEEYIAAKSKVISD